MAVRNIEMEVEVAALGDLSREELAAQWQKAYGCSPPKGIRLGLLVRAAAWHLQAKKLGGLSAETRLQLRAAVQRSQDWLRPNVSEAVGKADTHEGERTAHSAPVSTAQRQRPAPGARLVRVWNDRTHIVAVIQEGFLFDGKMYRSPTAIARRITGAHWSGPRFFGL